MRVRSLCTSFVGLSSLWIGANEPLQMVIARWLLLPTEIAVWHADFFFLSVLVIKACQLAFMYPFRSWVADICNRPIAHSANFEPSVALIGGIVSQVRYTALGDYHSKPHTPQNTSFEALNTHLIVILYYKYLPGCWGITDSDVVAQWPMWYVEFMSISSL